MSVLRIEEVVYGVEDLAACERFFTDVGLEFVSRSETAVTFRTPVNQFLRLHRSDDPSLPAPAAPGPNIREVIWGVDTETGVAAIARELSRDRAVNTDPFGAIHSTDPSGYGIGFKVAQPTPEGVPTGAVAGPLGFGPGAGSLATRNFVTVSPPRTFGLTLQVKF